MSLITITMDNTGWTWLFKDIFSDIFPVIHPECSIIIIECMYDLLVIPYEWGFAF